MRKSLASKLQCRDIVQFGDAKQGVINSTFQNVWVMFIKPYEGGQEFDDEDHDFEFRVINKNWPIPNRIRTDCTSALRPFFIRNGIKYTEESFS